MAASLLHPVNLTPLAAHRGFGRSGQLASMIALVLAVVGFGLLIS